MTDASATPLLTTEDILGWISAHQGLKSEIDERLARAKDIEKKISGLSLFLPAEIVSGLVGDWRPIEGTEPAEVTRSFVRPSRRGQTLTAIIEDLLERETGGRSVGWMREQIQNNPATAHRLPMGSPNLTTALGRMRVREEIVKDGVLYYLPALHAKIASGEVEDRRLDEPVPRSPMGSSIREIIAELGRGAVASKIVEKAKERPDIVAANVDAAAGVYRWLSREKAKGRIFKKGPVYSLEPVLDDTDDASSLFDANEGGSDVR